MKKVLLSFLLSFVLVFSYTAVFATEADNAIFKNEPTRQYIGNLIASGATGFYHGGSLQVILNSGNAWADIQAGTAASNASGFCYVSVTFPDETSHYLGTILSTGGHTLYNEFSYLSAGTYTFYFTGSTNDWIEVYANIYD